MASRKRTISRDEDMYALYKEWDEVSCSICMEHPHNAVLLLCSSHDKGCRSYICDTSYRHSNCLDRFKRLKDESRETPSRPSLSSRNQPGPTNTSDSNVGLSSLNESVGTHENHNASGGSGDSRARGAEDPMLERTSAEDSNVEVENLSDAKLSLRCPLCRGSVLGWKVVEDARKYLNLKPRSCSRESCSFSGHYRELRRHARRVHPTARPTDVHPSRQRAWRRLENQREYDDIVSAIRSSMPGAVVYGDYVVENGDRLSGERARERDLADNGRLLSTLFLFQMLGSMELEAELSSGRTRALSRHRRSTGAFSRRRFFWGENLLGLQNEDNNNEDEDEDDDDDDDDEDDEDDVEQALNTLSDMGEDGSSLNPRRRRRLTRSMLDEGQL